MSRPKGVNIRSRGNAPGQHLPRERHALKGQYIFMTAISTTFSESLASETAAECALIEHVLQRLNIQATITIGNQQHAPTNGHASQYAIHLTRTVPLQFLLRALADLHGRTSATAVLMTAPRPNSHPYREHLLIDANAHVLSIRRHFHRPHPPTHPSRHQLLGIAWKCSDVASASCRCSCWRTAHAILRIAHRSVRRRFPAIATADAYFTGPTAHHRPLHDILKRLFDILFSLAAIVATLPISLAVIVLIKAYDRGPIFFVHQRESRNGRPFGCLKFRTMVRDAHRLQPQLRKNKVNQVDGPQFKIARDPRITPIGNFLRKSCIDELPQFLNVLLGHMSVVGPRPSPFEENQLCPAWREARLSVKPGITGLWQVSRSPHRGPTDFQEWILYDTQYVERRGFWLDVKIILLTVKNLVIW